MKKIALLFLLFLLALPGVAQVKIQPQAGLTLSRLTTDEIIDKSEARVGTDLGVSFRFGNRAYFYPGVYWKRWSSDLVVLGSDTLGPANFTLDVQSIQVPARLGVNLVHGDLFKLRINGGPAWTRVVKLESDPIDPEAWNIEDFNNNIWSWQAGMGIDLWFLTLDVTYDQGINTMFVEGDAENRMLSLEIGVVF
ncbi:MAG: outer membrane beta-barrel protein [Flavobacteriales bacterium]|nr:outer membrane beta-barrel protein [Flavobacteriales bacterium]